MKKITKFDLKIGFSLVLILIAVAALAAPAMGVGAEDLPYISTHPFTDDEAAEYAVKYFGESVHVAKRRVYVFWWYEIGFYTPFSPNPLIVGSGLSWNRAFEQVEQRRRDGYGGLF